MSLRLYPGSLREARWREVSIVAVALATMTAIVVARIGMPRGGGSGLTFLLALPVALVAARLGLRNGIAAAAVALGLVGAWDAVGGHPGWLGYSVRAVVFALVAVLAAHRTGAAPATLHDSDGRFSSRPAEPPAKRDHGLSPRELEVLRLIACGHTNREIADRLVLSVRTVETHRARLYSKLRCSGRAALYRHAVEMGLVQPPAAQKVA